MRLFTDLFLKSLYLLFFIFSVSGVQIIYERENPNSDAAEGMRDYNHNKQELIRNSLLVDKKEYFSKAKLDDLLSSLVDDHKDVMLRDISIEDVNQNRYLHKIYNLISHKRELYLQDKRDVDNNNFRYKIYKDIKPKCVTVMEEYLDESAHKQHFFINWDICIDMYHMSDYTPITPYLSYYESGYEPNYHPQKFSSIEDAKKVLQNLSELFEQNNFKEAAVLLRKYTSEDSSLYISEVKEQKHLLKESVGKFFHNKIKSRVDENGIRTLKSRSNYHDLRFAKDFSGLEYIFKLKKVGNKFVISDVSVSHFTTGVEYAEYEDLFFLVMIFFILVWGATIWVFHTQFRDIIKLRYPATYKNLGKQSLTGNDNWTPYINSHSYIELNDEDINFYGYHLNLVYTKIRVYLMMMVLAISVIKIISSLA